MQAEACNVEYKEATESKACTTKRKLHTTTSNHKPLLAVQLTRSKADADKCGLQHFKYEHSQIKLMEEHAWRGSQKITYAHVNVSRLQACEAAGGTVVAFIGEVGRVVGVAGNISFEASISNRAWSPHFFFPDKPKRGFRGLRLLHSDRVRYSDYFLPVVASVRSDFLLKEDGLLHDERR